MEESARFVGRFSVTASKIGMGRMPSNSTISYTVNVVKKEAAGSCKKRVRLRSPAVFALCVFCIGYFIVVLKID